MMEFEVSAIIAGNSRSMPMAISPCAEYTFWYYNKAWHMTAGHDPGYNSMFFHVQSVLALHLHGGRKTYRGKFKIKVSH
ncbi:hypothetical protein [Pantoea septica]|uniref:hypothetical protein n=1 Tax=Pantoea septica TaxID=472695 RepID=UPI0023F65C63|nr:hypothetical protein [Pantoea septica]